jgi:hypothetical protein
MTQMILKRVIYFVFFGASICFLSGCAFDDFVVKKDGDNVTAVVPTSPLEDTNYVPVLNKWMKNVQLYSGLELYFQGYAVLMSPEMIKAYEKRVFLIHGNLNEVDSHLAGPKGTISVFLNAFSKSTSYRDFDNSKIWSYTLKYHGNIITNPSIYRYRNMSEMTAYFPESSSWSRIYTLSFVIPKELEQEKKGDNKVIFSMKSAESQSEYTWDENVANR